ncbi:MAG: alpha/beta fold hydrolase [Chlamydiota bacterium]|nr:alpha/beta fold hydrolase [Chlamydiota bacterium]
MKQLTCLHGFLGTPSDWDFLPYENIVKPNLFSSPPRPFCSWAKQFNQNLPKADNILLGYSLGGRLAIHAMIDAPQKYSCAIIISSHYGLKNEQEKLERLEKDASWAKAFQNDSWDVLMEKWNNQGVFNDKVIRRERDYNRNNLAEAMLTWSLGEQLYLKKEVERLKIPILWIAGENDRKFKLIAQSLSLSHPESVIWIAKESGHRVPWQQQAIFLKQIDNFILTRT